VLDRLVPVAFVLVDRDEMAQCRGCVGIHGHQVAEQRLRAIEQAGAHVVLAEFQQRHGFHGVRQSRAGDQVLVQPDRPVDLATAAEKIAQRKVGFHRVAVVFGQLEEYLDGLVLLLVKQVVQAAKIVRRELAHLGAGTAHTRAPRGPPTTEESHRQEQQRVQRIHE
jgi:hypothetical protein